MTDRPKNHPQESNVVPLFQLKARDSNCIFRDAEGGKVITYLLFTASYEFEGNDWIIEIWAKDMDEAQRKLAAISAGKIDGQVMEIIPA